MDLILAGIHSPDSFMCGTTIDVGIAEISTDKTWVREAVTEIRLLQSQGVDFAMNTLHRYILDQRPSLVLAGEWTRVSDSFIRQNNICPSSWREEWPEEYEGSDIGDHQSQVLSNNIHLNWRRTMFTFSTTAPFQYTSIGWDFVEPASEPLGLDLCEASPSLAATSRREYLFVASTHDMDNVRFDVAEACPRKETQIEAKAHGAQLFLAHGEISFRINEYNPVETFDAKAARIRRF